jgi:arylsulfatase A-like enzyme
MSLFHFNISLRTRFMQVVMGGLCLAGLSCEALPARPSILVIMVDTLRADYLGSYGFPGPISPNLDALADESYVFERCYAAAPWTKPSIASLFTSLNPLAHGVTNHEGGMWGGGTPDLERGVLPESVDTLAERLSEIGYQTTAFVANPWITEEYGFAQGFDIFRWTPEAPADWMAAQVESVLAIQDGTSPQFIYLHVMEVHGPYNAGEGSYSRVKDSPTYSSRLLSAEEQQSIAPSILGSRWTRDEHGNLLPETREIRTWEGRYAAGVREVDYRLSGFLERLRDGGFLDAAYVIVTSDHGEELFDHEGWEHGYTLYEEQVHVPLIVRPPGGLTSRRPVRDVVGLIDVLPTLADVTGADLTVTQGRSLEPYLRGKQSGSPAGMLSTATRTRPRMAAVVRGEHKLIVDGETDERWMFNVLKDPRELNNLAWRNQALASDLLEELGRLIQESSAQELFEPGDNPISEERRELLESLGYTN